MKRILILLVFVIFLGGCAKEETKTSYLQQFVKEDTTVLDIYYSSKEEVTKERVLWQLENIVMGFLEKEYDIKEPENPEPNQVYEIVTKDDEKDQFKVYYVNDTTIITAERAFIERAIEILKQKELEKQGNIYASIDWGLYICRYDIGKESIQPTDTELIEKIESYIQSILPYLNFEDYILEVHEGDILQMSYRYCTEDMLGKDVAGVVTWISPLDDTYVDISIGSRDLLDKFLYNK